jgi:uncharacterized protein YaiI (UPF0178 family)
VPWLIDAMNVIGSRPDGWWRDRHGAMERLVDQVDRWAQESGEHATVVFERPPDPPIAGVHVETASAPEAKADSADDEIVRLAAAADVPDAITVVTSDRRLAGRVKAIGASVEGASEFRRRLRDET